MKKQDGKERIRADSVCGAGMGAVGESDKDMVRGVLLLWTYFPVLLLIFTFISPSPVNCIMMITHCSRILI